ncbi:hypothetical protein PUN28_017283 [Cardiocondyla obscurior]|uniref:XRE family transcriptional regulator n=1 Tax=Cardiocondyla obscurior TaxID=286306 RepID=A0AAW2EL31_9HYME
MAIIEPTIREMRDIKGISKEEEQHVKVLRYKYGSSDSQSRKTSSVLRKSRQIERICDIFKINI